MLYFLTIYIIIYTLATSMHRMFFLQYAQICIVLWQQLKTPKHLLVIFYAHKKTTILTLKWIYHSQSAATTCLFSTTAFHFCMPKQHLVQFLPVLPRYFSSNIISLFLQTSKLLAALLEQRTKFPFSVPSVKGPKCFWTQEKNIKISNRSLTKGKTPDSHS